MKWLLAGQDPWRIWNAPSGHPADPLIADAITATKAQFLERASHDAA